MIAVSDVTKKFGPVHAVQNASFTINKGEHVAFLGRSGAGKTTLMNLLTGYVSCTHGSITVNGFDMLKNPLDAKKAIGYLPQVSPLYNDMTVDEYLNHICSLRRVPKTNRETTAAQAAEQCKISEHIDRLISNLSLGEKRRTALAGALCGNTDILICDEPTLGLEPVQKMQMRSAIANVSKSRTLIVATSAIGDAQDLCEKIMIMRAGKIVAEDRLDNMTNTGGGKKRVCVRLAASRSTAAALLNDVKGADNIEYVGCMETGTCDFIVESFKRDLRADIFRASADANIVLLELKPMSVTLEELFSELAARSGEGAP